MNKGSPLRDKPLRHPGQSLDEEMEGLRSDKASLYALFPAVMLVIASVEWFGYLTNSPRQPWAFTLAAVVFAAWGGLRFIKFREEYRRLKLGRDGEKVVGQFLDGLRVDGARIFHDVRGENFNIDHVLISSRGIYAVETKTLSKRGPQAVVAFDGETLLVDGFPLDRNPLVQSRAQAAWLARLLKESTGRDVAVRGVVVFPGWFVKRAKSARGAACWVLEPKELPGWLENEPERLSHSDVSLVAFHLSRYIWTT